MHPEKTIIGIIQCKNLYKKLARLTLRKFFVQVFALNGTQLYSVQETWRHVTRIERSD